MNTTDARVELWFDVAGSAAFSPAQRERLLAALRGRLDQQGRLRVVAQRSRSQLLNRREATARLQAILAEALRTPRPRRRATRPTAAARQRRLEAKRRRAAHKRTRRPPAADDDR